MAIHSFGPASEPSISRCMPSFASRPQSTPYTDTHPSQSAIRRPKRGLDQAQTPKRRKLPLSASTPKTAFEKGTFLRNATTSPLLRLPSELRNRIWSLVLGERVIHVQGDFQSHATGNGEMGGEWVLRGRECGCPFTDKRLFENYMTCLKKLGELEMETGSEGGGDGLEGGGDGLENQAFTLDFSTLENPEVLATFDFDDFLNPSGVDDFQGEGSGAELALDAREEGEVNRGTEMETDANGLARSDTHNQDQDQAFDFHSGTMENPYVLESFDFDAFLNQSRKEDFAPTDYDPPYHCFTLPDSMATLDSKLRKRALLHALESKPHASCRARLPGSTIRRSRPRLSLHLLRACRQIYGEANPIFWSSNTFSFSSPDDFTPFMDARSGFTKALITKLRLDFVPGGLYTAWLIAFRKKRFAPLLRGLQALHLHVTDDWIGTGTRLVDWLSHAFAPFWGLGLKDVTIVVAPFYGMGLHRWPADEYIEVIERVRGRLMSLVRVPPAEMWNVRYESLLRGAEASLSI